MKLSEVKTKAPKFPDIDAVKEKLEALGSGADIWMGEPNLEKLMKHLNEGGKIKSITIDCSRADDKHEANEIMDKKVDKLKLQGWELFDYEWDGDGETVDVILIKK